MSSYRKRVRFTESIVTDSFSVILSSVTQATEDSINSEPEVERPQCVVHDTGLLTQDSVSVHQ